MEEIATPSPPEKQVSKETVVSDSEEKAILEIIYSLQNAVELFVNCNPIMTRSLHFKDLYDKAIEIYEELYKINSEIPNKLVYRISSLENNDLFWNFFFKKYF